MLLKRLLVNIGARAKKKRARFWTSLSRPRAIVAGMHGWSCGTKDGVQTDKHTIVVVARKSSSTRERAPYYDEKVQTAPVKLWRTMDLICSKRLQSWLPELITVLERHNEFRCDRETTAKLLRTSAAIIDRLLRPERRKYELRGRAGTKPGTLLKKQIPDSHLRRVG